MYHTYMPNKTISLPDDVVPIIASLDVPFSTWVADQLRRYAASRSQLTFREQLELDASLANEPPPSDDEMREVLDRMDRGAPW